MVNRFLIITLLLFSSTSVAGGWVKDWYENVYEEQVAPQQREMIRQESLDECEYRIRLYRSKVIEDPKSEYYQYKLEQWMNRCN